MAKLDADTKAVLRDLSAVPALTEGDPDIAVVRRAYDQVFAGWTAPALNKTEERWVSACGLGEDQALVIEPASGPAEAGSGALILIHGGGWSLGSALCYAPLGRWLCAETGRRVIVPDFPQAPEAPAPAAYQALSALLVWAAARFGPQLSLIGDSAGGNLAAVLSNHPPEGVRIDKQVLLYPVLDLRPQARYRSRKAYGSGRHFLTTDGIVGAAMQYCAGGADPASPRISPLLETDFSRTPPTVLLIPEFDPLHDEGLAYAERLRANQVAAELVLATGTIHGCVSFHGRIRSARAAMQAICQGL